KGKRNESAFILRNGFQKFVEEIFALSSARFIPNAKVIQVDRKKEKVEVLYKEEATGKTASILADKLILACNLKESLNFLDASPSEQTLFSNQSSYSLITSLVSGKYHDKDFI